MLQNINRQKEIIDTSEQILKMHAGQVKSGELLKSTYADELWYQEERKAVYALIADHDASQARQHFYNCGILAEYLNNKFDSRILDYGSAHIAYAILSDDIDLMNRFAGLAHSCYQFMVDRGHSTLHYVVQRIIADDLEEAQRGIKIMEEKSIKRSKALAIDRDFFEGMLNNDIARVTDAIARLLLPKNHNYRNKHKAGISDFISCPALGYTKLAWLKGMEIDIDHPLVPKDLLEFRPLLRYGIPEEFSLFEIGL